MTAAADYKFLATVDALKQYNYDDRKLPPRL